MDKSTEINKLPYKQAQDQNKSASNPMAAVGNGPPNPVNTGSDAGVKPAANFAQMPMMGGMPGGPSGPMGPDGPGPGAPLMPRVGGPGQGISAPQKPVAGKKEFFGLKETDYKSTIVVFALVLIFSSNLFFEFLKTYLPAVMSEGKVTLIGSLIAALLASIIYIVVKCICNMT